MKCEKKSNIPKISEILSIVAQEHRLQIKSWSYQNA